MLNKYILLTVIFLCSLNFISNGQAQKNCSTVEHDLFLRSINPQYATERIVNENNDPSIKYPESIQKKSNATLVIPVVVHVVYNNSDQNISDEQIISQIDVLNEDYSTTNANIVEVPSVWANLVGSAHLFFALARKDENGNSSNGIIRVNTSQTFFSTGDLMKYDSTGGSSAWNSEHFLNIWVCNLSNGGAQDILGYAQYPSQFASETDGVVINYKAFGRIGNNLKSQYNLGRTATHEIGHWLNLLHIWGDDAGDCSGTDQISDTPNQGDASYGCPNFPKISCSNSPNGNMFMDYMDYTDDQCMCLFTTGQRSRMDNAINNFRDSLQFASDFALPVGQLATDLKIMSIDSPAGVVCNRTINPVVKIQNTGLNDVTGFLIKYSVDNDSVYQYNWSGTLTPGAEITVSLNSILISEGIHTFISNVININGGNDNYSIDNFKTISFLYAPDKYNCPVFPEVPEITVLPNPANESVFIETKFKDNGQPVTFSIFNVLGKLVYTNEYLNSHGQIYNVYVNYLPSGIYFIEVKTFNQLVCKKLIVSH